MSIWAGDHNGTQHDRQAAGCRPGREEGNPRSGCALRADASGVLTLTETALPVLADASDNPVFFTETGEITGTVSGVAMEEESQDAQR